MNPRLHLIEVNLKRTAARWRWLRFLQHSSTLGATVCLLFLVVAAALLAGWTPQPVFVTTLEVLFVVGAVLAWFVIGIAIVSKDPQRPWLAGLLERGQPKLLDRINTLVYLEKLARRSSSIRAFYLRIARQAQGVLAEKTPAVPLSPLRAFVHLVIFIAFLAGTIAVYERYAPHQRLQAAREAELAARNKPAPEQAPELALPTNNLVEQKQPWGEVRITEPARDLQVTKVDVVPLQIEAAANEALQHVGWASALNGATETAHELAPPNDPRYAVYQPSLYLDELRLSDWDVLTYYAKANTERSNSFASEVYFLEVRPFREDILKMPGGENGKAYQCLNELTALINRQQHVIRQTHQHAQKPFEQPKLQAQDRDKLADAESDVSQSTSHLYAKMASEMENQPIGDALDQLAKAEKDSRRASDSLRADTMPEAQNQERSALSDLVAARKIFQKVVSEHPDAFTEKKDDEPPPPTAEKQDKLKEIAEFRNETKAAQDFVQKTAEKQQQLARQAATTARSVLTNLANQEKQLQQSFDEFQSQHPKAFRDVKPETEQAEQHLAKALASLQQRSVSAKTNAQQAASDLQKLGEAMKNKNEGRQLADAYKLKQMLDKQIETFGQCQNSGDSLSGESLQKTIGETRETLKQLKNTAEQQPTRDAFGPKLRDALSDPNMTSLNWPLGELERAQDKEGKEKAAGQAKEGLAKVSKAFTESEPQAMQEAQKNDSLKPGPQESLGRGLAQLQSLIKEMQENRDVSPQDQAKQGQEALYNLQLGLREMYGSNERGNQIMLRLQQELKKGESPVDVEGLKKLMDELQNFSLELTAAQAKKEDKPDVTNIDPSKLPPAYRGRIEKYFQKLSEK